VVPPRSFRLFEAMWHQLRPRGLMRLLLAEQVSPAGGQPALLAGSIILGLGRTAFYAFSGRRRDALALRPNDVIQWRAIHDACEEGFRVYDFGEVVAGDAGLADFKRKWGTEPRRMYRYHCPPAPPGDEEESEEGAGGLRARAAHVAGAVWKRLPLAVTRVAGDRLYRYL
jgi:hypothetical protein